MKNLRPIYRDVKDWAILESKIIHDFSIQENPIEVVEVLIGKLIYDDIGINKTYEEFRTPIIRWLTRKEYDYLIKNSD